MIAELIHNSNVGQIEDMVKRYDYHPYKAINKEPREFTKETYEAFLSGFKKKSTYSLKKARAQAEERARKEAEKK